MRNLKKVIALVAVFAMMISTVAFAQTFSDVAEGDNYYEAIETLNKLGIITGDDENNDGAMEFRPSDSITRAEISVIVARIQGSTGAVAQNNTVFTDVPSTYWASGYIAMATNQGIVNGYGDGTFGPDDKVLYEDVVKMLMETLGYKPFATQNGGYPTGYILAAQQQSVLKNVVGGAEGTEATRGQVAQMTYNAIDTPLMQRYVYGSGQDQYVVWDGESWSPRKTLMNQNLGITKLKGIVTENNISGIDSSVSIDTSSKDKITLKVEDNYLGSNDTNSDYEIGSSYSFYTGETSANDYLGYDVVLYAQDNKNETDTVLSITEATGRNTKTTFTLDNYDSLDGTYLCYMKNDTDKNATKLKLQNGDSTPVIYNGRAVASTKDYSAIDVMFGDNGIIQNDTKYSGEVVALDNDDTSGYDVIYVNIATAAVVDELSTKGIATFKNTPGEKTTKNNFSKIEFNSTDTDQIINITKDGKAFNYEDLKEWDVLSVISRTDGDGDYFDINVLASTAVTGTVSRTAASDTSEDNLAYTISGVDYDLAPGYYTNGTLKAGSTGTFYIDAYGKIVAYNKDANGGSTTADNYGYVVDGDVTDRSGFNKNIPEFQILYKDGKVGTYDFKTSVTIENPTAGMARAAGEDVKTSLDDSDKALNSKGEVIDSITYKYKDAGTANADTINNIVGRVVTFNATEGYISSITLPLSSSENTTLLTQKVDTKNVSSYDEDTEQLNVGGSKVDIPSDALVFFIGKSDGSFKYQTKATETGANSDDCTIGTGADLRTNSGFSAVTYTNNDNDTVDVVVLYNTNAGTGASTGLAYISSIGNATVDGTKVLSVEYYQDGESKTAYTDEINVGDLSDSTNAGSIFKFGFTGDKITSADCYLNFVGRDKLVSGSDITKAGTPKIKSLITGEKGDESFYYGAVIKKVNNKITIAKFDASGLINPAETETVSLGNKTTNYYLYDPSRTGKNKYQLASYGDILCDKQLANDGSLDSKYTVTFEGEDYVAPAYGMLDFVYIRTYDSNADVVDYTTWEYDYSAVR